MRAPLALAVVGLMLGAGCSSVPDVEYLDVDAATSNDGSSSGSSDGGGPAQDYNCTDNKPPADRGICCGGSILCLNCDANHCPRCERDPCKGDEVCCARNPGNVECRRSSACPALAD